MSHAYGGGWCLEAAEAAAQTSEHLAQACWGTARTFPEETQSIDQRCGSFLLPTMTNAEN